jgi:PAS domain S-box-containing protein
MTSKRKADRVAKILDSLENAAAGDYSAKLDFASENDDLGLIAAAVNKLLQKTEKSLLSSLQTTPGLTEDAGRYRHILDNIEESYFEVDLKGNINFVNDTVIRDLGYSQEELRGINFHNLVDETNAKKLYEVFHQVFLTGQSVKVFDWEILKKNKGKIDVESSVALLRDRTGKPVGFRGVVRDISQRVKARKDLQQSEEKYHTILDIMDEGYIEQDLKGSLTFANDAACRLMGYPREQLIGMHYNDYLTPAVAQKMKDVFGGVYRTGLPDRLVDYNLVRPNGTVITYEINVALKRDASEKPCGFLVLIRDVSLRKKAEEEKRLSEEKYRTILEIMQEGYFETNLSGILTFVNDAGCKLVGYPREEIINRNYSHYSSPETAKRVVISKMSR